MNKTKKAYLSYFSALLLFGSNGVVASSLSLPSGTVVFLRSTLGSATLLALFLLSGRRFTVGRYPKDMLFIALSGAAMAADWLLLFEAYAYIGVSCAMLVNYTDPALVVTLSPLLFKERVTLPKVVALFAALLGACLVSGRAAASGVDRYGLLYAVFSAVAYALMVLSDKLARSVTGLENAVLQLLCAAIVVTIFTESRGGLSFRLTPSDVFPVLVLGLVNTGIGCGCYFSSIGALPAQTVAVCGYLEPLFAVLLSVLILREMTSPLQMIGVILIVGGAIFGECFRKKRIA